MASPPPAGSHAYPPQAGYHRQPRHGTVTFAAVLLFVLAFFNGLDGIAAINRSHIFLAETNLLLGNLLAWGWVVLALGIAQALAGFGVLAGGQLGRWFGVAVLGLNAFAQMWFLPVFPLWALVIIALDIVAIYGLAAYAGPEGGRSTAEHRAW